MSFPPIPDIAFNISKLNIDDLVIKDINMNNIDFKFPMNLESIYIVFFLMFTLLLIQTTVMSIFVYKHLHSQKRLGLLDSKVNNNFNTYDNR